MFSIPYPNAAYKRRDLLSAAGVVVAALLCVNNASAQSAGTDIYPASYFSPFTPQTAMDMIIHVPGFRFDAGDESLRGLAGSAGNVLVDGDRPAAKMGGLKAVLAMIPATHVIRIEILRGGGVSSEASGQTLILNIIRTQNDQSLTIGVGEIFMDGTVRGQGSVMATRNLGPFQVSATTLIDADGERSRGYRARFDRNAQALGEDELTYRTSFPEWSQRVSVTGLLSDGKLTANGMIAKAKLTETWTFANAETFDHLPKRTDRWRGELSFDWAPNVGHDYTFKILGLTRFIDVKARSLSERGVSETALAPLDMFRSEALSQEGVVRFTLARAGVSQWRPEVGLEISRNTLDSQTGFTIFNGAGVGHDQAPDYVKVSELRGEAFVNLHWTPSAPWTLMAGLAVETSDIQARAARESRNRFTFLKPTLSVFYRPDALNEYRLSLRRSVGQLSFGDFAASANLAQGTETQGNTDLGPDHKISVTFDYNRRFGAQGALSLNAFHDWREDVLELAVLPSGATATINAGRARAWGVNATVEVPLTPYIPGAQAKLRYACMGSMVVDPVTGASRPINGFYPDELNVSFRQNLKSMQTSWGAEYRKNQRMQYWYADEVRDQLHSSGLSLFVETTRFFASKIKLEANSLNGVRNTFYRSIYYPNRTGAVRQTEVWDIRSATVITLSLNRTL